jgi:hypothetical protein
VRNFNPIIAAQVKYNQAGTCRPLSCLGRSVLAGALMAAAIAAQAQTTTATAPPAPADESLTWHGINLYGIVDVDLQYETHGAPFSNYLHLGRLGHRAMDYILLILAPIWATLPHGTN